MRKGILVGSGLLIAAAMTIAIVSEAWAKCPYGTVYRCDPTFNGKMACGCK